MMPGPRRGGSQQVLHDPLTGLPNHDLMHDRARRVFDRAVGYGDRLMAALIIDLDHCEHARDGVADGDRYAVADGDRYAVADGDRYAVAGGDRDRLLVAVASRLREVLARYEDAKRILGLGRYGDDAFLILCERLPGEHETIVLADRVRQALAEPFAIEGHEIELTASIGIACAGGELVDTQPTDADGLLGGAEMALARARGLGGDRYEVFDERVRARVLDRVLQDADLRAGLARGQLLLHYQPVVAVAGEELAAVEALVRWRHPLRGLLAPDEFVPGAEQSDLIVELGTWVIDEACAQIRRWRDAHPAALGVPVSVNVSAGQLSPALVEVVEQALARNGVAPSQLALEITESRLIAERDSSRRLLEALKRTGVSIVLDDFGTGYSSLSYLRELPLDQLKLDRSFCAGLGEDARSEKIVAATIEMARALGMTVVAEGVETTEQIAVLKRLGCDFAQGFWVGRPEDPEAILERLREAYERDRRLAGDASAARGDEIVVTERRRRRDRRSGTARRAEDRPVEVRRQDEGQRLARLASEALAAPALAPQGVQASHQRSLGRLTGLLFLIGSVLAIPADLVMHAPSPRAVILLTLMGGITGAACLAIPWDRISPRWLGVAAALGTVEITVSVVAIGRHATVLTSFYLLVATAVAYGFADRRLIAAQTALIVAAMLTPPLLLRGQPPTAVPGTLVAVLVMAVTTVAIVYLRERLERSAAQLRELAASDPLTEVGNYRLLHERLSRELERHQREREPLAVLLIDLDRFKRVNERLGHAAGDDVLRRVASTLSDAVREQDTVARQGGDEFAVLAPSTDHDGAALLAGRLRQRLRRLQFAGEAIDATIGWAVYPVDGVCSAALLAHADAALLDSKHDPGRLAS